MNYFTNSQKRLHLKINNKIKIYKYKQMKIILSFNRVIMKIKMMLLYKNKIFKFQKAKNIQINTVNDII